MEAFVLERLLDEIVGGGCSSVRSIAGAEGFVETARLLAGRPVSMVFDLEGLRLGAIRFLQMECVGEVFVKG